MQVHAADPLWSASGIQSSAEPPGIVPGCPARSLLLAVA
jgi:hypothetical protein